MKYKMFFVAGLFFLAAINLNAQFGDDLLGQYRLPNKLDIEIFKDKDASYSGRIVALNGFDGGQEFDVKNKDKSKRKDLLLGKVIITNLKFNEKQKKWIGGRMYGPEKGMHFNLKVTKIFENEIEVIGSKYFFWKTMRWEKMK